MASLPSLRTIARLIPVLCSNMRAVGIASLMVLTGLDNELQASRPLDLNDLFNQQQVGRYFGGPVVFSTSGHEVAVVIQRPVNSVKLHVARLFGNDRADVFVMSLSERRLVNITNGLMDEAGYWAPSWSPDGQRLAMLSTKGGNICLWIWERETRTLRQLSERGVKITSLVDRPYVWSSTTRILVNLLPRGVKSERLIGNLMGAERATAAWSHFRQHAGGAISIFESDVHSDLTKPSDSQLTVIDAKTRNVHVINGGEAYKFLVSPDRNSVAYARTIQVSRPDPTARLPLGNTLRAIGKVFELAVMSPRNDTLETLKDPAAYDVIPDSLSWSPDGTELVFFSYTKKHLTLPLLCRLRISSGTIEVYPSDKIDPSPVIRGLPPPVWTISGWLVFAARSMDGSETPLYARRDWWLLAKNGSTRCITGEMNAVPARLWGEPTHDSYLGLAPDGLWRISLEGPPQNLTATMKQRVSGIVWPSTDLGDTGVVVPGATDYRFLVTLQDSEETLFTIDLSSGKLAKVTTPSPNAVVVGFSPASKAILYLVNDHMGLHLWLAKSLNERASRVFEANEFLREVTVSVQQRIVYRDRQGEKLHGLLFLPPGYQPKERYPLVVWVYPGWTAGGSRERAESVSNVSFVSPRIVAARGYVVLRPSIPLKPEGTIDDPMLNLASAVLPAIDKVNDLCISDPNNVFVLGHSLGGFAVNGLITQTSRFNAAVTLAGYSNLISAYNEFDLSTRYGDSGLEKFVLTKQGMLETALRLGSPPWKDPDRYRRNSPISYVDQVQTPLMLIHGDMDDVQIEQAEEFFMALYRQGKRASFVRYWGEGHMIESPNNIRDMWNRIFRWFEKFSKPNKTLSSNTFLK